MFCYICIFYWIFIIKCLNLGGSVIDEHGYRLNVGIVVINDEKQVLWARRATNVNAWQFPQGGIKESETPVEAMYRELYEELGLLPEMVEIQLELPDWYIYDLPKKFQRHYQKPLCIGQKQRWFLLRLTGLDADVNLNTSSNPEFSFWEWVDYWYPLNHIIDFKKEVYENVLLSFENYLSSRG